MSKIIRITEDAYKKLAQIAVEARLSKQVVIEQALEAMMRDNFFKKANAAYEALKKDPVAWQEELQEREEWEAFNDNLEDQQ